MLRSVSHGPRAVAVLGLIVAVALMCFVPRPAGAATLPDGRAYEMVSPPQKNGGDVVPDSQRTRAAADGSAVGFTSLGSFAGNLGTGVSSDYLAIRSTSRDPGTNGWDTTGIMPVLSPLSASAVFANLAPLYSGEFSADLSKGLLFAWGSLGLDATVSGVANLFRNDALRTGGGATYDLVSTCPACTGAGPLPVLPGNTNAVNLRPRLAASDPTLDHVAFESMEPLTTDTPAQPGACDMTTPTLDCHAHAYEWDNGTLRLAGRVPTLPGTSCDDVNGPACVPADVSLAGAGTGLTRGAANNRTPHAISDGTDGHVRLFFTQPTDASGQTSDDLGDSTAVNSSYRGRLYMRVDGTTTVQIDASERTDCADHDPCARTPEPDAYAPAEFLDASSNGTRAFFMTTEALTNDAPTDGQMKLYMYDATKPAGAADNLTFLSADSDPNDAGEVQGTIGVSNDGHYVYFVALGQLVSGQPDLNTNYGIFLWHDGALAYVGRSPRSTALNEIKPAEADWAETPLQSRVTPDGRHLLFTTNRGAGLLGYDHGFCSSALGLGCRELYVYDADTGQLACPSCNPTGAAATQMATDAVWEHAGAATTSFHLNRAISDDGSRVFFTTAEALVPEDTNGRLDAYEWTAAGTHGCPSDAQTENGLTNGCISLLSTGEHTADSYFLDASANGNDAFFITRERLVGWDTDDAYDLYDARVGGGFPEPPVPPSCAADTCQGNPSGQPALGALATTLFQGAGNLTEQLRPHVVARPRVVKCKRGYVRKRVKGKVKCVKKPKPRRRAHKAVRAKRARHGQRRGA